MGGVDPDVVEAAALAHDIGHPPFGHIAEKTLDDLITPKMYDGFEGNAQSFRVVNKLVQRSADYRGLDLCRATLNAILKYPWKREQTLTKQRKWGYYITESEEFVWAREDFLGAEVEMSLEAKIMDWCDDIAYPVSDLEDFYRAGVVPLDRLVTDQRERKRFYKGVFDRWKQNDIDTTSEEQDRLKAAFKKVIKQFPIEQPYIPTRRRRAALRSATSGVIDVYVRAPRLVRQGKDLVWEIDQKHLDGARMLKEVTWEYVITNPALARQQYGKATVIKNLFEVFRDASDDPKLVSILPANCQQELNELNRAPADDIDPEKVRLRLVADVIAKMTDYEALRIHERVTGIAPGSIFDRLPR